MVDQIRDTAETRGISEREVVEAVEKALNVDRYQRLLKEYNAVAETYDVLSEEYSQSELETKDEFGDLRLLFDVLEVSRDAADERRYAVPRRRAHVVETSDNVDVSRR
jgi:hypothetical protein